MSRLPTRFVPAEEIERVRRQASGSAARAACVAALCRLNVVSAIRHAGSGHLGSSLSALDIMVWLHLEGMDARDVFFSSKGHDAPALYAVLHAMGRLTTTQLLSLRRLGGPEGHPDRRTPGVEANTGSLGMGVSKARGMAWARRRIGLGGRVFVLTGDGELQEGQVWEALQNTAHQAVPGVTVVVDRNEVQSDRPVRAISDLGDLPARFAAFGWEARRCDGHDFDSIAAALARPAEGRPLAVIAETIKGCGVSFMEHPRALREGNGSYRWHAGAPDDEAYAAALAELEARIAELADAAGVPPVAIEQVPAREPAPLPSSDHVGRAYGRALVEAGERRSDLVVLDADLALDCRIRDFEELRPAQFVENGIAEQDMVSMAGGLALQGLLPVVNTFASFLAARANEQIYNNAGEGTRIVYAAHYAGLLPAGAGKSHQSVRDIALLRTVPGLVIVQPSNGDEAAQALRWAIEDATSAVVLRLALGPSPRLLPFLPGHRLVSRRGTTLAAGADAVLFAYGPVMLGEALGAGERLCATGAGLEVVALPWLTDVDPDWLVAAVGTRQVVFVLDDHAPVGGLGDTVAVALAEAGARVRVRRLGVTGMPACGAPAEVLRHHGLDADAIAGRVRAALEQP